MIAAHRTRSPIVEQRNALLRQKREIDGLAAACCTAPLAVRDRTLAGPAGDSAGRFAALSGYNPRPVLGLTTYLQQAQTGIWDVHASFLPAIYMEGVNLAGGTAVLLPPQPIDAADRVLDGLDGLIITGGRDMDPAGYGQQRHPATDEPVQANRERDAWEIALMRGALRRGMPVLGICRGAQVVNVALGGTLHQHLPDVIGHTAPPAGQCGVLHVGRCARCPAPGWPR